VTKSGAEATAVQTLARGLGVLELREASGDDMSSWLAGAEALHQPTVCSNKN